MLLETLYPNRILSNWILFMPNWILFMHNWILFNPKWILYTNWILFMPNWILFPLIGFFLTQIGYFL